MTREKTIDTQRIGPILLVLTIVIGLIAFLRYSTYFLDAVKVNPEESQNTLCVDGTLFTLNDLSKEVPKVSIEGHLFEAKKKEKFFYLNVFPSVLTWVVFHSASLCIGIVCSLLLLYYIVRIFKKLHIEVFSKRAFFNIGIFVAFFLLAGYFFRTVVMNSFPIYLSGSELMEYFGIIFVEPRSVIGITSLSFGLIWLVPLTGILVIKVGTQKLLADTENDQAYIKSTYKLLRDGLNIFALFLGLLVAAVIFGTKLQRNMISSHLIGDISLIYPDEFIVSYGLCFTLFLSLFFLPALFFLKFAGRKKEIRLTEKSTETGWWKVGKETLADAQLTLSIILPLLSGLMQEFIL